MVAAFPSVLSPLRRATVPHRGDNGCTPGVARPIHYFARSRAIHPVARHVGVHVGDLTQSAHGYDFRMSTSRDTVTFIEDQLGGLPVRTAAMFGEYAIYLDDKVVGFICDDTLFIKPSDVDPAVLDGTYLAPAYPGSKMYNAVPADLLDDAEWLRRAIRETAAVLPPPKPKKPKAPRGR